MLSSFGFTNLLGATFGGGNVQFTPDGNGLVSPVGNRVNVIDLVQGRTVTFAPENKEDIKVLALTKDSRLLLSIDRRGSSLLYNFVRGNVLSRFNFKTQVVSAKWSPDSHWLAITVGRKIRIYRAPVIKLAWQFVDHQQWAGHFDDVLDIAWAPDSFFLVSCSKDMSVRIWPRNRTADFQAITLVEHRSEVRGAFFSADMLHMYSVAKEGVIVTLRYETDEQEAETSAKEEHGNRSLIDMFEASSSSTTPLYCRKGTWDIQAKGYCDAPNHQKVTRCDFEPSARILVVAFTRGIFMLYEMPEQQALQTLSLGTEALDTIALGAKGDWVAVGCSALGQLLVWEWRSETYILKQQGHHYGVQCVAFSPAGPISLRREKALSAADAKAEASSNSMSGRLLATGGYDGKVKLFNSQSGLCFVTFAEHTAPVSGICFTPQGNAVLTASKDGSVRAFDLLRYRNFRTFTSPDGLCQFTAIAVDGGGEIVAASSTGDRYAVYVWSIQTGNVLEQLVGHTSPVQDLQFSPSASTPGQLITASWDRTMRVWDLYAHATKGGSAEELRCPSDVLAVAYDPRGNDLCACACLSGQVLFWNVSTAQQVGSVDGLRDILRGRQWHEQFSVLQKRGVKPGRGLGKAGTAADGLNLSQHFNSIAYARSGELLLCGCRNSPLLCLYDTSSHTLAARLTLTTNRSLSGVNPHNHRDMTEAGITWQEFDISDESADELEEMKKQRQRKQAAALPGVSVGEAKSAYSEKELHVWSVAFSADSQQLVAATTHGIFVYSADMGLGSSGASLAGGFLGEANRFAPQMLTSNVSAPAILTALDKGNLSKAMILALALNDYGLLRKVYEAVPVKEIPVVVASIGAPLLPALLWFLSAELRPTTGTPHYEFHVRWVASLVDLHFVTLLEMAAGKATPRTGTALEVASINRSDAAALCLQLLVELTQRHATMARTFDSNAYLLRYLSVKRELSEDVVPSKRMKLAGNG